MSQTSDNVRNIDDFRNKYGIKIRYLFLLHPWSSIIDLNDDTIRKVLDYQKSMDTYFEDMKAKLNKIEGMPNLHGYTKFNEHDVTFHKHFSRIKQQIHLAFCDSIDTRTVLEHIRDLTSITMKYADGDEMPNINLIKNVDSYISRTIDMFGL
jgi:cysteinyl-tRNA synthetase